MVRGCQKKIIYLKNTQSEIFEEAYFVIKDTALYENTDECDMVEAANKILDENFIFEEKEKLAKRVLIFLKSKTLPFAIGMIVGVIGMCFVK